MASLFVTNLTTVPRKFDRCEISTSDSTSNSICEMDKIHLTDFSLKLPRFVLHLTFPLNSQILTAPQTALTKLVSTVLTKLV